MMVPINRGSIRRSPNAGATRSYAHGRRWDEVEDVQEVNGVLWCLRWVSGYTPYDAPLDEDLRFTPPREIDCPVLVSAETCSDGVPGRKTITHHSPVDTIYHQPIPLFTYRYRNSKVTCRTCSKQFPHTKLQSESYDIDTYVDNICPFCGEPECCQVEYEQLSDVELGQIADQNEREKR